MNRNQRRLAHDLKRGGETAYGIDRASPIVARGNHCVAQNDEPEPQHPVCTECVVAGGENKPCACGKCHACRNLAQAFAQAAELGRL